MKISKKTRVIAITLLACMAIVPVVAQQQGGQGGHGRPPQGPGRGFDVIVRMSTVQKELGLSQNQIEKINSMRPPQGGPGGPGGPGGGPDGPPPPGQGGPGGPDGHGGPPPEGQGGPGREPRDNPLAKILSQEQLGRLKQLGLQFEAPMSLLQKDVADALGFTDTDRQAIHEIIRNHMAPPQEGQHPDWKSMMAQKAAAMSEISAKLSSTQKAAWSRLIGKVFTDWVEPKRP